MIFKYKVEFENYKWNFNSLKEFADYLIPTTRYEADTDMSKDGLEKWGYSIKIKKEEIK